jgi:FkbM family methyltransferase
MRIKKRIANALGYDLLRSSRTHALIERHLEKIFRLHKVECVLDVGANTGQYAEKILHSGFRGQVHSFEPVANTFKVLEQKASSVPNWYVYPFALGDEATKLPIQVLGHSNLCSFHQPTEYSRQLDSDGFAVSEEQSVEVRRLDTELSDIVRDGYAGAIYLKMDTQGFDLNVFRGAAGCLDRIAALQTELSIQPLYEGMPPFDQVMHEVMNAGFHVTGMYPAARNKQDLTIIEFDCVMARAESSATTRSAASPLP